MKASAGLVVGLLVTSGGCGRSYKTRDVSAPALAVATSDGCVRWGRGGGARAFDEGDWFLRNSGPRFDGINSADALRITRDSIEISPFIQNHKVYTAAVRLSDRFSTDYGTVAVEAKICVDDRIRSAIWLQSPRNRLLPDSGMPDVGAEIDMIELFGAQYAAQNLHHGGYEAGHRTSGTRLDFRAPCEWHEYRVDIGKTTYRYYVDGILTWHVARFSPNGLGASEYTILSSEYGPNQTAHTATLTTVEDARLGVFSIRSVTVCKS